MSLLLISLLFTFLLSFTTGCTNNETEEVSSTSWAYSFVVWNGHIYKITGEHVEKVEKEIGDVTIYSDKEGNYTGNFSNTYKKGTKYFSIKGTSSSKAIAVQEQDGRYRKALKEGKYGK